MSKMVIDSLKSSFQDPLHWQKTLEVSTVNTTLGKVVYLGIALVLSYVLSISVYRLWFHPLAGVPGPFLGRVTDFYGAYHSFKGDVHIDIRSCHETFGSHIRYSPNFVSVNTAEGLRDIYGSRSALIKSDRYKAMVHGTPNTITTRDKREHMRKRKPLTHALSDSAQRNYEAIIVNEARRFCDVLTKSSSDDPYSSSPAASSDWGRAKNMSHWFDYLSFDIMTQIVFGKNYETLTKPTYRNIITALEDSHLRVGVLAWAPVLGTLKIDRLLLTSSLLGAKKFLTFMYQVFRERLQAGMDIDGDIFSFLMRFQNPESGKGLSRRELSAEAPLLIVAASDTTSTALAALFFYLSRYPDARSRVTNEIRSRFSTVEDVVMGPALNACSYLRACVNEALRLCPPVPGPLLREVPSPGAVIDGLPVPGGGYEVGTCTYSIHRNPEYFPDPHTYMPERWLASNRKETEMKAIDRAHSAFAPFSVGSRSCIGKKLAMTEMMIIVATMLVKFDFEVADGPDGLLGGVRAEGAEGMCRVNDFQISDHLNAVKDGPMIKFRRRVGEKGHTPSPPYN